METRERFISTAVLVVVALGGAGLAVAADRAQDPSHRPELTWPADQAAARAFAPLVADLKTVDSQATTLAKAARDALGNLQGLDIDAVRVALDSGDAASEAISALVADVSSDKADADAHIERYRLGPTTSEMVGAMDSAVSALSNVPRAWQSLDARALAVVSVIDDLQRHDGLVFRATTAGRQGSWADALSALDDAAGPLAAARQIRDLIAADSDVSTLDDLIARYDAYDAALVALYGFEKETGQQSGAKFDDLQRAVQRAQTALPADTRALSAIVGGAAGRVITESLVAIEQARGAIMTALASATAEPQ
jgi:hypothetical protein